MLVNSSNPIKFSKSIVTVFINHIEYIICLNFFIMWILFTIYLALSCQLEIFEDCLGNGKRSTKCIKKSNCIEQELEIKVPQNQLLIKGFVVDPEVKFEIGELIGCDLFSYELCFNLQAKDVVGCLRKIDCINFIEISELREEYNDYFANVDYNQFNNRYNNNEAKTPTKEEEANNDLFYVWKQIFENQGGDNGEDQEDSKEVDPDESFNFGADEEFEIDGQELENGVYEDSDQIFDINLQGEKNEVDHNGNEADTFFEDLWKIEQDVVKNQKETEKKEEKNSLEELSIQEIGDKIQDLYDEWEKAQKAQGDERAKYQWMMDEQGELKELDVLLGDLYIVYRKKLHEAMETQYKNKPADNLESATQGTNESHKKSDETLPKKQENVEKTKENNEKTKENKEIPQKTQENPHKIPDNPAKKDEKTEAKNKKDTDYIAEIEMDLDIEDSKDIPEDYEKEFESEDIFNSLLEEITAFEKRIGTYRPTFENGDIDLEANEDFVPDYEEYESTEYKLIGIINDADSGLEPNMNDRDFDGEYNVEESDSEYNVLESSEEDDRVNLKTAKKSEFLQADNESTDSCEKSCEQRCLNADNDSCLSDCLSSVCYGGSTSSDYFTVIVTGLSLFCVVSVIYLFMKNRNIRIGYENYIKGHTS